MGRFFIDLIKVLLGSNGEIGRNENLSPKLLETTKKRNNLFVLINALGDKV